METKTAKIVAIPEAVNWLAKVRGRIVQGTGLAESVRRSKQIGYADVVISYPQKRILVKKYLKEHIVSFENGIICGGDQVMIDYNWKTVRIKAKVPDKISDSQITMDFTNFRVW